MAQISSLSPSNDCVNLLTTWIVLILQSNRLLDTPEPIYEISCVGECDKHFNIDLPPIEIKCRNIAIGEIRNPSLSKIDWVCTNRYNEPISGFSVSCDYCPGSLEWWNVKKNTCGVEVEYWAQRNL